MLLDPSRLGRWTSITPLAFFLSDFPGHTSRIPDRLFTRTR
jgi:hypothetical protein